MQTQVKVLLIDIETAPSLGWVWEKYETNVIDFKSDWYILSFGYKWLGEDQTKVVGLVDFPRYDRDRENDKQLMKQLWKLLDEADIVIGHNLDKFDIKKINTRFLTHGLNPPTPYKTVDTLKIARSNFAFDSNKLDDLGRYLGIGRKLPNTGFYLWRGCMIGDRESWAKMKQYNGQDVQLLEKVYNLLFPWDKKHPAVNLGQRDTCPKCGSQNVQKRGFNFTLLSQSQRYVCLSCRGWFQGGSKKIK